MKKENCIVAQSGGPTAAINASLAGVIDGVRKSGSFTRIYGSLHGITGVLENNMMDMSLMALSHFPMLNTLELYPEQALKELQPLPAPRFFYRSKRSVPVFQSVSLSDLISPAHLIVYLQARFQGSGRSRTLPI